MEINLWRRVDEMGGVLKSLRQKPELFEASVISGILYTD